MPAQVIHHRRSFRHAGRAFFPVRALPRAAIRVGALAFLVALAAAPVHASDDAAANLILPGQAVLGHFDQRGGENLYRAICQGCHMPDGRGAKGAAEYPALAGNSKLASGPYPVLTVLGGRRGMPAFGGSLTDQQIADVVNYVRTHFDNGFADSLSADDVARLRTTLAPGTH